jgi:hypothetical protein
MREYPGAPQRGLHRPEKMNMKLTDAGAGRASHCAVRASPRCFTGQPLREGIEPPDLLDVEQPCFLVPRIWDAIFRIVSARTCAKLRVHDKDVQNDSASLVPTFSI